MRVAYAIVIKLKEKMIRYFGIKNTSLLSSMCQINFILLHINLIINYQTILSVSFPPQDDLESWNKLLTGFYDLHGMWGVAGAVDGSGVQCAQQPGDFAHRAAYIDREGNSSMKLQAICASDKTYLDVCCPNDIVLK